MKCKMDCKKLVALSCQFMSLVATVVAQDAKRAADTVTEQQRPSVEEERRPLPEGKDELLFPEKEEVQGAEGKANENLLIN